ncbi:MAG TPA: hypothetical protein PLW31_11145 [Bacteroidales bacterium]|nr:hypothetical protein [Bacteroidales bacterium]HOX78581.1 hypothetical protein [Bacteroidales bacterium]HPI87534.1 hypothetical protein [Bacteroidales bacterium]
MKTDDPVRKLRGNKLKRRTLCYNTSGLFNITRILIITILLPCCIPCYYTPNVQNVPLFNSRNQANFTAGYRFGTYSRGWDIQSAYSITDHIGVMGNYQHFGAQYTEWNNGTAVFDNGHFKGDYFEFGAGYYTLIPKEFIFESYAGTGWGKVTNEFSYQFYPVESAVNYNRYFVQPSIGWRHSHIGLAFSTRFCVVHYTRYKMIDPQNTYDINELMGLEHNPCWLLEPAFTFRGGGRIVKFQVQACLSFPLNNKEINYDPFSFSFGVVAMINGKTGRKEK